MLENFKYVFSVIGGIISLLIGGFDIFSSFLLIMIFLDIITGCMKAKFLNQINSNAMFLGACKKISIILVVYVTTWIDKTNIINYLLRDPVIFYFLSMEGISFIENISIFLDLPKEFTKFFKDLNKEENNNE